MTRIYIDTEFIEDGHTIDLISIALVVPVPGGEDSYYAVNRDMPARRIARHDWLMANVVPGLPRLHGERLLADTGWFGRRSNPLGLDYHDRRMRTRQQIADVVQRFIRSYPDPELWAWYSAFDHVALAWLFGPMSDLPDGIPMHTNDLKQEAARLGVADADLPQQPEGLHNALADARHNVVRAQFLDVIAAGKDGTK